MNDTHDEPDSRMGYNRRRATTVLLTASNGLLGYGGKCKSFQKRDERRELELSEYIST